MQLEARLVAYEYAVGRRVSRPASSVKPTPRVALFAFLVWASLAVVLSGCSRTYEYRYRVVVEVNDNGVSRVGEAVSEHKFLAPVMLMGSISQSVSRARSEAVAVPLKDGSVVVATMRGLHPVWVFCRGLDLSPYCEQTGGFTPWEKGGKNSGLARLQAIKTSHPIDLRPDELPVVIVFAKADDPASARLVSAGQIAPNVQLKRMTIQRTTARPTSRIDEVLPWLRGSGESSLKVVGKDSEKVRPPLSGRDFYSWTE